ncbi:MAG: hypothetical protein V3V62_07225 [bacterium]
MTAAEVAEVYRQIPGWARGELSGLSEAQLDRTGPEGWAQWPPRRQLSHMAYITTRWIMLWFGALNFSWDPVDMSQFMTFVNTPADDRRFSAARYNDPAWLHAHLEEVCATAAERLEEMEKDPKEDRSLLFVFPAEAKLGATEVRLADLWERMCQRHPDGMTRDPELPHAFRLTPLGAFRHTAWDNLIHLRTLRLHREAMGLAPAHPDTPTGGYVPVYPIQ